MIVPVFRPTIRRKDMDSVLTCLVSDRIGAGALAQELVAAVGTLLGTAGGYGLASFTEAICYALEYLGIGSGDGVVVSPLMPAVYGEAFRRRGVQPILADVDLESGLLSAGGVQALLGRNPKAVIMHHTLGLLPDGEKLRELGLPLIEDISPSLGGYAADTAAVLTGDVVLLSLEPENLITAGGGGLVLVRTRKELKTLRDLFEERSRFSRLADLNAALGLAQVREVDRFITLRREIGALYRQSLGRSRHRTLLVDEERESTLCAFPVLVEHGLKEIRQYALRKEIETRLAFTDILLPWNGQDGPWNGQDGPWNGQDGPEPAQAAETGLPAAQTLALRCLVFPLYPALGRKNVETVSKVLTTLP